MIPKQNFDDPVRNISMLICSKGSFSFLLKGRWRLVLAFWCDSPANCTLLKRLLLRRAPVVKPWTEGTSLLDAPLVHQNNNKKSVLKSMFISKSIYCRLKRSTTFTNILLSHGQRSCTMNGLAIWWLWSKNFALRYIFNIIQRIKI